MAITLPPKQFVKLRIPENLNLASCPLCGSAPELYECIEIGVAVSKFVCCSRKDEDYELRGVTCVLATPPVQFYYPSEREATRYWSAYAAKAVAMRNEKRDLMLDLLISRLIKLGKMRSSPGFEGAEADLTTKFNTMPLPDLLRFFELTLLMAHKEGFQ